MELDISTNSISGIYYPRAISNVLGTLQPKRINKLQMPLLLFNLYLLIEVHALCYLLLRVQRVYGRLVLP